MADPIFRVTPQDFKKDPPPAGLTTAMEEVSAVVKGGEDGKCTGGLSASLTWWFEKEEKRTNHMIVAVSGSSENHTVLGKPLDSALSRSLESVEKKLGKDVDLAEVNLPSDKSYAETRLGPVLDVLNVETRSDLAKYVVAKQSQWAKLYKDSSEEDVQKDLEKNHLFKLQARYGADGVLRNLAKYVHKWGLTQKAAESATQKATENPTDQSLKEVMGMAKERLSLMFSSMEELIIEGGMSEDMATKSAKNLLKDNRLPAIRIWDESRKERAKALLTRILKSSEPEDRLDDVRSNARALLDYLEIGNGYLTTALLDFFPACAEDQALVKLLQIVDEKIQVGWQLLRGDIDWWATFHDKVKRGEDVKLHSKALCAACESRWPQRVTDLLMVRARDSEQRIRARGLTN